MLDTDFYVTLGFIILFLLPVFLLVKECLTGSKKTENKKQIDLRPQNIEYSKKRAGSIIQQAQDKANALLNDTESKANSILASALSESEAIIQKTQNYSQHFHKELFTSIQNSIDRIIHDESQTYPWLAELFSEYAISAEKEQAFFLRHKVRPALKKAESTETFAAQKKALIKQCKMLEHQLLVYESIFPWLEDFKLIPPDQLDQFTATDLEECDEYQTLRNWLSPEEYNSLSSAEKYQLALDRYLRRNKTDWEAGREYERFIGFTFESSGWQVRYIGATDGKNDRGIDLIATKGNSHYVIQCKRWSPAHRIIRENAICQLAGSAALYDVELTRKTGFDHVTTGVFVTTTTLSDIARDVAEKLNVILLEEKEFSTYPCIKCHVSNTGEKIYHLPFDQQYDRIIMEPAHGDLYVETTAEAEALGFRKAFRWHSKQI